MCGIVGLRLKGGQPNAAELAMNLLFRLQHRGQDGAGISVLGSDRHLQSVRGLGLVHTALKEWATLPPSHVAVAHTRYATTGTGGIGEIQPFIKGAPRIALAHNGNIINTEELKERYKLQVTSESDLDVIQQILLQHWHRGDDGFVHAVRQIYNEFNGAYAVVGLEEDGTLFAFRDPFGIRPLYLGESNEVVILSSETCVLSPFPKMKIEEIPPGYWVRVKADGTVERGHILSKINPEDKKRFCMFEIVYFSSPQSEVHAHSVYRQRFQLGAELARLIDAQVKEAGRTAADMFDYVVPVPETSRTAAIAVAEVLGVPYREFLVKNPYVPRTFILASQGDRLRALSTKLNLIGPEIKGRKILLVDDSVVRGNTSRLMCERLREAGALEVALASTCPPIRHGCFYGIDFPDPEELVAYKRDIPSIADALGVKNLYYLDAAGLKRALGTDALCMACLDGEYPTYNPSFKDFLDKRRRERVDKWSSSEKAQ
jgi:amidophosphoribosyltransferase